MGQGRWALGGSVRADVSAGSSPEARVGHARLAGVVRASVARALDAQGGDGEASAFSADHPGPPLPGAVHAQVRALSERLVGAGLGAGRRVRRWGVRRREGLPGVVQWVVFVELVPSAGRVRTPGAEHARSVWGPVEAACVALGGRLTVEASGGAPGAVVAWATLPDGFEARALASGRRFPGLRVLVVDDNRVNQAVLEGLLGAWGCRVTAADHGGQAVDLLRRQVFDLVLMDLQMPVMDGYEATRWIRSQGEPLRRLPVVVVSANCAALDREASAAVGVDAHLGKPVHGPRLARIVRAVLHRERPTVPGWGARLG